jgi:hypothetical protein
MISEMTHSARMIAGCARRRDYAWRSSKRLPFEPTILMRSQRDMKVMCEILPPFSRSSFNPSRPSGYQPVPFGLAAVFIGTSTRAMFAARRLHVGIVHQRVRAAVSTDPFRGPMTAKPAAKVLKYAMGRRKALIR